MRTRKSIWIASNVPRLRECKRPRGTGFSCRERFGVPASAGSSAFTLIELILILALLAVATSVVAPSLTRFFRGRLLDSEARLLLSTTHAAQSRAISEGFPVLMWIDPNGREYGLQLEASTAFRTGTADFVDPKAVQFVVDPSLRLTVMNASPTMLNGRSVNTIRFLPDGVVDETSPTTLRLESGSGEILYLIQATNRMSYEIRTSDR